MKVHCDSIVKHTHADEAPPVTREQIQQELVSGAAPLIFQGDGSTEVHFSVCDPDNGSFTMTIAKGDKNPFEVGLEYTLELS